MRRQKKAGELEASLVPLQYTGHDSFQKTPISIPPKDEPFNQEMHLKMPLLSLGLILSNLQPECRVSALHFFMM
jgi:hypothetical protein